MFPPPRYPLSGGPIPEKGDRLNYPLNSKLAPLYDKGPGVAAGGAGGKKIPEFPAVGDQLEKATPIIRHNRPARKAWNTCGTK
jgi:hypothetical protein